MDSQNAPIVLQRIAWFGTFSPGMLDDGRFPMLFTLSPLYVHVGSSVGVDNGLQSIKSKKRPLPQLI